MMRLIDAQYTARPFYGSRRMTIRLNEQGDGVNRERVQRLMRVMGLEAIDPNPRLIQAGKGHRIYPDLLRGVTVQRRDQVWSTDITYVPMASGFMYLAAVIDWNSRYVIAWRLSNTPGGSSYLEMRGEASRGGRPEAFNTDQGVQFTAAAFTGRLESAGVVVSMDGRGRASGSVFAERLWWSVNCENIYIQGHDTVRGLHRGLARDFTFSNDERPHQSPDSRPPAAVYRGPQVVKGYRDSGEESSISGQADGAHLILKISRAPYPMWSSVLSSIDAGVTATASQGRSATCTRRRVACGMPVLRG